MDKLNLTPYEEFQQTIDGKHFPEEQMSARAAQAIVASHMWTDSNPMLNLSSFVTTYMEEEGAELMAKHAHVNYIDHDMYPRCYDLEAKMVNMLHDLYHGPKDVEANDTDF